MNIYIFGNGNTSFADFKTYYETVINRYVDNADVNFLLCDFKGVDTLAMEVLKCTTANVHIYHVGDKPRYLPDVFRTKVSNWTIVGGFANDASRDAVAIEKCTHFIAIDFNSDAKRKSGTLKNIERCEVLGKIRLQ
jgi:hypothetical protein